MKIFPNSLCFMGQKTIAVLVFCSTIIFAHAQEQHINNFKLKNFNITPDAYPPLSFQPRLQWKFNPREKLNQIRYSNLANSLALIELNLFIVRIEPKENDPLGSHEWTLFSGDGAPIATGFKPPIPEEIISLLTRGGFHSPLQAVRGILATQPWNWQARLTYLDILCRRLSLTATSVFELKAPYSVANNWTVDFCREWEKIFNTEGWINFTPRIESIIRIVPISLRQSIIRRSIEKSRFIVENYCREDPSNFEALALWLSIMEWLEEDPSNVEIPLENCAFIPGPAFASVPPKLPNLILNHAITTRKITYATRALKTCWELGGQRLESSYISTPDTPLRAGTVTTWNRFGLPYLESLIRAGDSDSLISFIRGLDNRWAAVNPMETAIGMAQRLQRPQLAEFLQSQGPIGIRPPWPGLIRAEFAVIYIDPAKAHQAQSIASRLIIDGISTESFKARHDWIQAQIPNSEEWEWGIVDRTGRVLLLSKVWALDPEEDALRIIAMGVQPSWNLARDILSVRPKDPEALALLALGLANSAMEISRLPKISTRAELCLLRRARWKESLDALRALFSCPRQLHWASMTFIAGCLNPMNFLPEEEDLALEAIEVTKAGIHCVETHLERAPQHLLGWRTWAVLKAFSGGSFVPKIPAGDLRELGIGPYPPVEAWQFLADLSFQSRKPEEVPIWLGPILDRDFELGAVKGPGQNAAIGRIRVALGILIPAFLQTGQPEQLEALISKSESIGLRGCPVKEWIQKLPPMDRDRLTQRLEQFS